MILFWYYILINKIQQMYAEDYSHAVIFNFAFVHKTSCMWQNK